MRNPMTGDELFNDVPKLKHRYPGGPLNYEATVDCDRATIAVFQGKDILSLTVDEARPLRDWLNKVIP
jgi:hypothetical protein